MLCARTRDVHVFLYSRQTNDGDDMTDKERLLSTLATRTHASGQQLRELIRLPMAIDLKTLLEHQIQEYLHLEYRICAEAASVGLFLRRKDPLCLLMQCKLKGFRLSLYKTSLVLRNHIIQQCTLGIRDGRKVLSCCDHQPRIRDLAQQLIDSEQACIGQLKKYIPDGT